MEVNKRGPLRELNQNVLTNTPSNFNRQKDNFVKQHTQLPEKIKVESNRQDILDNKLDLTKQLAIAKCIISRQNRQINALQKQVAFQKLHSKLLISEALNSFPKPQNEKLIHNTPKKRRLDSEEVHTDEEENELKRFETSSQHPQTPISNRKKQVNTPRSVNKPNPMNANSSSTVPTNNSLAEKLKTLDEELNKVKINPNPIEGETPTKSGVFPASNVPFSSNKQFTHLPEFPASDVFHKVISLATASSLQTLADERIKRAQNRSNNAHDKLQIYKNQTGKVMSSDIMKTKQLGESAAHQCVESFRYMESDVKAPSPLGEVNHESISPVPLTQLPILQNKLNNWRSKYST